MNRRPLADATTGLGSASVDAIFTRSNTKALLAQKRNEVIKQIRREQDRPQTENQRAVSNTNYGRDDNTR